MDDDVIAEGPPDPPSADRQAPPGNAPGPPVRTFNSPLEAGLRLLFLLSTGRRAYDNQQLTYLDYMLVHSGDIDGPESLHPATPSRKGEILVRRGLLQQGLALMRSRELIERRWAASGVVYAATAAGRHVVEHFESEYSRQLAKRARWVTEQHGGKSSDQLSELLGARVSAWEDQIISEPGSPNSQ